jgi:hypothetical protein
MNEDNTKGFEPARLIKAGQESSHNYNTVFIAMQADGTLHGTQYMHDSVTDWGVSAVAGMQTCHERFGFHPEAFVTMTFKKTDSASSCLSTIKMMLEELALHSDQPGEGRLLKWEEDVQAWCLHTMPQSLNAREKRSLKHHGLQKVPMKSKR